MYRTRRVVCQWAQRGTQRMSRAEDGWVPRDAACPRCQEQASIREGQKKYAPRWNELLCPLEGLRGTCAVFLTQFGLEHRQVLVLFRFVVRPEMGHHLLKNLVVLRGAGRAVREVVQQLLHGLRERARVVSNARIGVGHKNATTNLMLGSVLVGELEPPCTKMLFHEGVDNELFADGVARDLPGQLVCPARLGIRVARGSLVGVIVFVHLW